MLMLKKQIFDTGTRDVTVILALDLTKTFDTVLHRYILQDTARIGLGVKVQAFVRSFLMYPTATIEVGHIRTPVYGLGARGTPQGSLISPLLIDIVTKGVSDMLGGLRGVRRTLYADGITIWGPGGSLEEMEQALRAALEETEACLADTSPKLSPSKSELLFYRPARQGVRGLTPLNQLPVVLHANNGKNIPRVDSVEMLGLLIGAMGCNTRTITHVTGNAENVLQLITRVSN
ncbi:uncharacterized protein LOC142588928 [Dermacentor variabilis]|uniref:uncharacterized protein LOC142588928 n=1 Tax=Dermacentor variabilis TaxID=34621 RepID=UPI003F5CA1AB